MNNKELLDEGRKIVKCETCPRAVNSKHMFTGICNKKITFLDADNCPVSMVCKIIVNRDDFCSQGEH